MKEILDLLKNIPDIITSSIEMQEANQRILIYEGDFKLKIEEQEINVSGIVQFKWVPSLRVEFSGQNRVAFLDITKMPKHFSLIIEGTEFGKGSLFSYKQENNSSQITFKGNIKGQAIKGDKSIPVSKITFAVPNLVKSFFGEFVKETTGGKNSISANRLIFEDSDYTIFIDKRIGYDTQIEELKSNGGYIILYFGELIKKKDSLQFEKIEDIFECFSTFLTFLNGRKCSPLFRQGCVDNEVIWSDYSNYETDTFKQVISWPSEFSTKGYNELWNKFRSIWKQPDGKDFLMSAIHWYVSANSKSTLVEGSIILAQTALELIYNWLVVEQKKMLNGTDAANISASNKIRLLLSQLELSTIIPPALTQLQSLIKESKGLICDAPEAFVQIRNAIVHAQIEKRKKLASISSQTRYEALELSIWYIELSILYILDFQGLYNNRCSGAKWSGQGDFYVPWSTHKNT